MRILGESCLLIALVGSGYAAFACIAGWLYSRKGVLRAGIAGGMLSLLCLTVALAVLAHALLIRDFSFQYVSQYSSRLLPWHYSLSALWVGQAGSLLLWAWMLVLVAHLFLFCSRSGAQWLRYPAFGLVMGNVCFLTTTMIFGADPMEAQLVPGADGAGLSPLLQHPAMLIHPPVVFIGYSAWAVPFALAISALISHGRLSTRTLKKPQNYTTNKRPEAATGHDIAPASISAEWVRAARPWALFAWAILGAGILLGAEWSYEELGWGGYWGWDPVENGSLIPWLTGTACLHGLMAWHFLGIFKKFTLALAIGTFGFCNFATFLTRSGIFSSLHAFSQSPIGWLFLALMIVLVAGGASLIARQRESLHPDRRITTIWSREAQVLISAVALLLLAAVALIGTLSVALSDFFVGRRVVVGPAFYNNVLIPVGLVLLMTMALAPLLRWGRKPTTSQVRTLIFAAIVSCITVFAGIFTGVRNPLSLIVTASVSLVVTVFLGAVLLDAFRLRPDALFQGLLAALAARQRQYAGFVIHLGFASLALGITGSSLGTAREDVVISPGQTIEWRARSIHFAGLHQTEQPDKFVAEAELKISESDSEAFTLRPAQCFHKLQQEWTTEVAIHSTWWSDLYTILHNGEGDDSVRLTLLENPLMRWIWFGGSLIVTGAIVALSSTRLSQRLRASAMTSRATLTHHQNRRSSVRQPAKV